MGIPLHEIPSWVTAVAREREIREAAYLGLLYPIACGVLPLPPLTLRHQMILYAARHPLVCGGAVQQADAMTFLWVLQPEYTPSNLEGRNAFFARLEEANLPWPSIVGELLTFVEESLLDAPRQKSKATCPQAPAVCGAAFYIELFATAFGWTRDYILDSPVICLNQERRCLLMKQPHHGITGGRFSSAAEKNVILERRRQATEKKAAPVPA